MPSAVCKWRGGYLGTYIVQEVFFLLWFGERSPEAETQEIFLLTYFLKVEIRVDIFIFLFTPSAKTCQFQQKT